MKYEFRNYTLINNNINNNNNSNNDNLAGFMLDIHFLNQGERFHPGNETLFGFICLRRVAGSMRELSKQYGSHCVAVPTLVLVNVKGCVSQMRPIGCLWGGRG